MKVLCIGDIHVKVSNVPEIDEMNEKLIELAKERRPDFIVLLGDILDRHATIHVSCLMRAEKIVLELSQIAPTFVIVGNHDRPNNSNYLTEEHPFNAMKLWSNTYVIDKVYSYLFSNDDINVREGNVPLENEYRFIFAPYVPPGRFMEALNTISDHDISPLDNGSIIDSFYNSDVPSESGSSFGRTYKTKAIFAHQEIRNAKMGAIISSEGDIWDKENPLLISGHIHDYDYLQENMIYVGVPLMHSFGDRPDKAVSLFTFLNDNTWTQERIDLGLIKKVTIYLTPDQIVNYSPPENKLVKLVVKGDEASIQTVVKLEKVQELKKSGTKVVFKTIQTTNEQNNAFVPKMSFKERLTSEISNHELFWFNKIFD